MGGEEFEYVEDIVVNNNGVYLVGKKSSSTTLVPKLNASNYTNGEGLLMRFSQANELEYVSSFPGERVSAIDSDLNGNVYFVGSVKTFDSLPTINSGSKYSSHSGGPTGNDTSNFDGFVSAMNSDLQLFQSFFIGAGDNEELTDIVVKSGICAVVGTAFNGNQIAHLTTKLELFADELNPRYDTIIQNLEPVLTGSNGAKVLADHILLKFNIQQSKDSLEPLIMGYYGGKEREIETMYPLSDTYFTKPSVDIGNGGEILFSGTTRGQEVGGTMGYDSDPRFIECNPLNYYTDTSGINKKMGTYFVVYNNSGDLIYTTYIANGEESDAVSAISYSPLDNRVYFGGNTRTVNGDFNVVDSLDCEDYGNENFNSLYNEAGPLNAFEGGWAGFLNLNNLYVSGYPCDLDTNVNQLIENEIDDFVIYPNPSDGNFTVRVDEGLRIGLITVTNIHGRKVSATITLVEHNEFKVELNSFSEGIYFVTIESPQALSKTLKILCE